MGEYTDSETAPGRRLQLIRLWYLCGAMLLLIVGVASLLPIPDVGIGDKLSHLLTYLVLGGWFGLLAPNRSILCLTVAGLMAYGILLEWLQGMTSYRFAEWGDVVANGSGILIGAAIYYTPLAKVMKIIDRRLSLLLAR